MAERPGSPSGPAEAAGADLDSTIDQLESLIEEKRKELRRLAAASASPQEAGVPTLTEQIPDVDPALFEKRPRPSREPEAAGPPRAAPGATAASSPPPGEPEAGGSDLKKLLGEVKRIVDDGVKRAVTGLKADVISSLKRELQQAPPPSDPAVPTPEAVAPPSGRGPASAPNQAGGMARTYDPHGTEQKRYAYWERSGYFQPRGQGSAYCIMLPPPNITGSLHMGHAFQDTLMDALIRYKRMQGKRALWQCGTDHAGIATQMVVERQLQLEGTSRRELGREAFVDAVWRWKRQSGGTITQQLRRMGASMDWSRERFTLDPELSGAVTEVFVRLFDEGLIYRGKRLVNWDPVLHTAISDLEVVSEEENGHLWHIRYPLEDGTGHVAVATTRPETMLGDVAVAVHPEDDRYRRVIGKLVRLPLTDRSIPVIADSYVDPEFGSGCLKITPAHDFNDYEVGARHGLPLINILTEDASISDAAPERYRGMDRYAARRRIVEDLRAAGLLARVDDHRLMVPRGDRSHAAVEPFLTDQWFVRIAPLAAPAIAAVEDGRVRFVPENWQKTYFEWMRNIEDWCISRQLWWGHRIPAWYDDRGRVHVGRTEQEARRRGGLDREARLRQDPDVLDTWFSSALWPFSTLGWPQETAELKTYYPTSVLVTGFDIIFFWVARMIMMGLKFMGDVPFREVYIHGLVRDADGNKMSKSKGNILDPIDLIDGIALEPLIRKRTTGLMRPEDAPAIERATREHFADGIPGYGADALRFTFASMATQGRDIRFDLGRVQGYRNFCNKIWNAARFVTGVCAGYDRHASSIGLGMPERWIVTRLQAMVRAVREGMDGYRFDLASQALYEFFWDEYCDWYIEIAKITLNDEQGEAALKHGTRLVLLEVLETSLRVLHPIMPFITDEVWLRVAPLLGKGGRTIMLQPFPVADASLEDARAAAAFEWLQRFVLGVRRIRAENNLEPNRRIRVLVQGGTTTEQAWLKEYRDYICGLARLEEIRPMTEDTAPGAATALAGETMILVPLGDLIDPDVEIQRLEKELDKLYSDLDRVQGKLGNQDFIAKAPADVVDKERRRLGEISDAIERLGEQRDQLRLVAGGPRGPERD